MEKKGDDILLEEIGKIAYQLQTAQLGIEEVKKSLEDKLLYYFSSFNDKLEKVGSSSVTPTLDGKEELLSLLEENQVISKTNEQTVKTLSEIYAENTQQILEGMERLENKINNIFISRENAKIHSEETTKQELVDESSQKSYTHIIGYVFSFFVGMGAEILLFKSF